MTTLFRRCLTLLSSTQCCFNVVLRCKFQHCHTQRCFNVDLTLCDVATSYQPKNNVERRCLLGHSGQWNRFLVHYKPFAFIQSIFLLVDTILEIKCRSIFKNEHYSCSLRPVSWIFADIPASVSNFSGEWKRSFYQIFHHSQCIQILG